MPRKCPICGGKVIKKAGEVDYYCADKNCVTRQKRQLEFFVSKNAFDIDGMGPKIVEQLMQEGLIHDASDIFELKEGDLKPLERFAEKSSTNLIESIEKSKNIALERFIYALGIRHVGSETATDIASQFGTIDKILHAKMGEFDSMYGVGEKVSESIEQWFGNKKNLEQIEKLQKLGVKIKPYHSPVLRIN
jgi:DNA ligase (NAD+)